MLLFFKMVSLMSLFIFIKLTLCICAITTCHDNGQTFEMNALTTNTAQDELKQKVVYFFLRTFLFLNNKLILPPCIVVSYIFSSILYFFL